MFKTQDIFKTMKKVLILALLIIPLALSAQNKMQEKADKNFKKFNFEKALQQYLKMEATGVSKYHATRRIADCYRLLNMPVLATEWYQKAVEYPDVEAETYYLLGLSLRILKRYDESEGYMSRYYSLTRTKPMQRGLSLEDYLNFITYDSTRVTITNLGINTKYSEFGPALWKNQLVFTSNRPKDEFIKYIDSRNNKPFFNVFSAPLNNLTNNKKTTLFLPFTNTKYNSGPGCFSSDENAFYISYNTATDQSKKSELDIAMIRFRNGKWEKNTSNLPLKLKGFSIAHPSISPDDERLYFVSDMPGGYGGMDIYYSERRGGFLSQPINLGPTINTPGDELFPYISADGKLFFTSNGHPGLGGLDIYVALPIEGGKFSEPFNLGPGINSSYDDFSIVFEPEGDAGYFASNRPGGKGEDDIYFFEMVKPLKFTYISGVIINKETKQPEADVQITVTLGNGTLVASFQSAANGAFNIHLINDEYYKFTFRKRMMEPVEKEYTPSQLAGFSKINVTIEMENR